MTMFDTVVIMVEWFEIITDKHVWGCHSFLPRNRSPGQSLSPRPWAGQRETGVHHSHKNSGDETTVWGSYWIILPGNQLVINGNETMLPVVWYGRTMSMAWVTPSHVVSVDQQIIDSGSWVTWRTLPTPFKSQSLKIFNCNSVPLMEIIILFIIRHKSYISHVILSLK